MGSEPREDPFNFGNDLDKREDPHFYLRAQLGLVKDLCFMSASSSVNAASWQNAKVETGLTWEIQLLLVFFVVFFLNLSFLHRCTS